ncbi:MAG: ATP-binding cassette domain-containing protein [Phycisphaerales bacterium]|nr:ATP-binding cassette domain-containing protein [Phycisphaerales bacterium]
MTHNRPLSDDAIRLEGVSKRFGTKVAVDNLHLSVPQGSLCGFLGPNGAGKTTTIRMIMSIILPDEGRLSVLGRASAVESKDRIGYLPEERGVYRTMTVADFLAYVARLKGVDTHGLSKKIDDWLEKLALPGVRKKKCQELSKGMQQKVQFAATVIHDPDLIILDEPFSGLDPVNARILRELILEQNNAGKTILFSTHVLFSAEQLCDRVFMVNQGRKVLDGGLDEIRAGHDPRTVIAEPLTAGAGERELRALPGVQSLFAAPRGRSAFVLHLSDDADAPAVMRAAASIPGAPMRRVEIQSVTLEDIFIDLVQPGDSEDIMRRSISAEQPMEVGADA